MAVEWIVAKLGDVCVKPNGVQTGPFGSQLHQKDYQVVGTPIITVEHLGENRIRHIDLPYVSDEDKARLKKYDLCPGDIVFSRVGSVDRRALVRHAEDGWLFSGRCLRVRPDVSIISPSYLSWFFGLPSFREHIRSIAVGATMPSLNTELLAGVEVKFPPLAEQQAIAGVLDAFDDKIELNRRMNQTLEAIAQALFQSWFVDFDPVRAKMEGRAPEGMDAKTAALFPSEFEVSELGLVPKGWQYDALENIVSLQNGYAFNSKDWTDQGVPVVKIGSVKPGVVDLDQVSFVTKEMALQASRYQLQQGDLLIGMTGYVGEVGLVPPSPNPPLLNQRVARFILKGQGTAGLGFIYCLTRRTDFKAAVERNAHGSAQANVSSYGILSVKAILATEAVRQEFDRICKPILDKMLANLAENRTLEVLRNTLLLKLVSGEVRAQDI